MLKGTQKKIIHIKNTDSSYFEEAYFVIRESTNELPRENDMLKEAIRIARLSGIGDAKKERKKAFFSPVRVLSGAAVMLSLAAIVLVCLALFA